MEEYRVQMFCGLRSQVKSYKACQDCHFPLPPEVFIIWEDLITKFSKLVELK